MARRTFINLNTVEIDYYPFMTNLDECNGIGNVVNELSAKICVPSSTKDVNVKVVNMTKIYEAKALVEHISCDCK